LNNVWDFRLSKALPNMVENGLMPLPVAEPGRSEGKLSDGFTNAKKGGPR
jgi:hypothetical protein